MVHKALELLLIIPRGMVTSYAELARVVGTSPRAIGSIMRTNKHPDIYPCYKVVKSNGFLGGYSGAGDKATKLKKDGVPVVGNRIPNIDKYLFRFEK